MMKYLLIGFCGIIGVFARYGIGLAFARHTATGVPPAFPLGTLVINIVGSFLIGVVYVLGQEKQILPPDIVAALTVGLLGGFTTFSSYSLEMVVLLRSQQFATFALYFFCSSFLGIAAAFGGIFLGKSFY